jgi:protein N-terminal amidase
VQKLSSQGDPMSRARLRVCALQTDPTIGEDVRANLARAKALVDDCVRAFDDDGGVGLVVAPEVGFGAYTMTRDAAMRAATEDAEATLEWARDIARAHRCHVAFGRVVKREDGSLANAQTVCEPSGRVAYEYYKSHLYCMDEVWAEEGSGFTVVELPLRCAKSVEVRGDGSLAIEECVVNARCLQAICMDINPYKFEAPWEAYELANAAKTAELIIFSSAWTNAHPDDEMATKTAPIDPRDVLNYWLARFEPLLGIPNAPHFVCANRIGAENDIQFVGCSCVIDLSQPKLVTVVTEREETARVAVIELESQT